MKKKQGLQCQGLVGAQCPNKPEGILVNGDEVSSLCGVCLREVLHDMVTNADRIEFRRGPILKPSLPTWVIEGGNEMNPHDDRNQSGCHVASAPMALYKCVTRTCRQYHEEFVALPPAQTRNLTGQYVTCPACGLCAVYLRAIADGERLVARTREQLFREDQHDLAEWEREQACKRERDEYYHDDEGIPIAFKEDEDE